MREKPFRAVCLLSGGLDSATAAAHAKDLGGEIYALTVSYGQRHARELESARLVAENLPCVEHRLLEVDLAGLGGSSLTGAGEVPKDRVEDEMAHCVPSTYVPARNTVLLSLALAWAEVVEAAVIVIGANVLDYSGYPDCRPEYLEAFERMANLATRSATEDGLKLKIWAPLISMTKAEIIKEAIRLELDLGSTWSCYDPTPDGNPCLRCDSCRLRAKGFEEAGVRDPLLRS